MKAVIGGDRKVAAIGAGGKVQYSETNASEVSIRRRRRCKDGGAAVLADAHTANDGGPGVRIMIIQRTGHQVV